ncbi:unnamed protein product [Notodromas monacha]|uniref:Presequence protease, mitochondrial n=1 Tax=Notodromas monacha TaxID=399045 RepID=A0A7R9G9N6_9CRUS|nr:unnamed protein product [Notodromas monacha]CAG0914452.1 unnamed protein product [Notodromas monacha]
MDRNNRQFYNRQHFHQASEHENCRSHNPHDPRRAACSRCSAHVTQNERVRRFTREKRDQRQRALHQQHEQAQSLRDRSAIAARATRSIPILLRVTADESEESSTLDSSSTSRSSSSMSDVLSKRSKRKRRSAHKSRSGIRGRLDVHKVVRQYPVGAQFHGFTVQRSELVTELDLAAILLKHDDTGCKYLHLARNDTDNVFATLFRTIPEDSTGAPHILEHYVLNGSEKYPIRDALLKMMTRSVYSFMNAFTADDFTLYPFSTTNAKDFKNLQSVYLDGIFRPLLKELDFMQEGWRLEPLKPDDPSNSEYVLKGIVLNEMKGVYSDSFGVMRRKTKMALYPSGPYGHEAGGDPLKIPDLSWEGTKSFYKRNYHPSNAKLFSYGDMPLKDHLEFMKHYLNKFQNKKVPAPRTITEEPRWTEPRELTVYYQENPQSKEGNKAAVAVTYALTPIKNDFENFSLKILSELLVAGPNAPFYKCLQESHLGTGMLSFSGYEGLGNEPYFLIGKFE